MIDDNFLNSEECVEGNPDNFIQKEDSVTVITNDMLVCRNCRYAIDEEVASCRMYKLKPGNIWGGGPCGKFAGK